MADIQAFTIVGFVANPGTITVTPQGTAGTKTWGYKVVGVDSAGAVTAASAEGTTSTGNAALDGTNFNRLTWSKVANAASYMVYRTTCGAASTPATTGLIGTVAQPGGATVTFDDTGLAGDATTASASNGTGVGPALEVMHSQATTVQYGGTFVATMQLQESIDGNTWANLNSAVNSTGVAQLSGLRAFLRIAETAYTSGTPTVTVLRQYPAGHR